MDRTTLGDRMKNNYENITRYYLTRRMPVIIRLDMKAGHTFTRGMKKPFDDIFVKTMQDTMKYLCENIQGCVLGYTQSDEISLVLTDYAELTTDAWFGNNLQKMCSVSASMATMSFNKFFYDNMPAEGENSGTYYKALEKVQCLILVSLQFQKKKFVIICFGVSRTQLAIPSSLQVKPTLARRSFTVSLAVIFRICL